MISEEKLIQENMSGRNYEGVHPNPAQFLTASSVIGDSIENLQGKHLGKIKDVMLDVQHGKIEYVIMQYKKFLGIGEKLFAIPFSALTLNPKKQVFIVDWDKEMIKTAPGFDKNHWPETNKHYEDPASYYWGSFMGPNTGRG